MAEDTTILGGDVSVYYLGNNRTKMMDWAGATGTYTMNELYSAMATLLDESTTIDDGSAFNADTPVEYTTGKIDSGDNDPWYVTFRLMQHITGGSLKTTGWTHVQDTNIGIVIVPGTNSDIVVGDVGEDISGGEDGNGTLLELIEGYKGDYLVIRPDTAAAGDEFTGGGDGQTITCNGHTLAQSSEEQNTGEMIWANIYSIGTIDPEVHMYVYQGARTTADLSEKVLDVNDAALDYWGNGHIDICVPIMDWTKAESVGPFDIIDAGYLRVYARKGGDLFSSFEVSNSTTSGGRNPVPMATSLDLDAGYHADANRGHGTRVISFNGAVGNPPFINGEIITGVAGARAILDLTNSTVTSGGELVYWPICKDEVGGDLADFEAAELITGAGGASATSDGAAAVDGASKTAWFTQATDPTIVFANAQVDVDNDTNDENYGITIDCNDNRLYEVYQWLKFIVGYGQVSTDVIETAEDLIFGEEYDGATAYLGYDAESGDLAEGEGVTQAVSGAKGVILSHDATTNDIMLLRTTRGQFAGTDNVVSDDDADYVTPDETGNFAAVTAAPLGTYAGGTYFGARGVVLTNVNALDENRYILTDIEGNSVQRPISVTITVTNVFGNAATEADGDLVAVYALDGDGGDIEKDGIACDGGEAVGDITIAVDAIQTWVPASGRLVLVDVDTAKEYVIGYDSYTTTEFQLNGSGVAIANKQAGTDENTIVVNDGGTDTFKRGDIIVNDTRGLVQYVTDNQAGSDTINCAPDIPSQVSGDVIYHNTVPDITIDSADKIYACVIHTFPTGNTASAGIVYPGSEFFFRVKVRNSRETDLINGPIKPYSSDGSTSGAGQSIPTVRTIDTIIS